MNWKRPSATQLCRVEYSFLLVSDYFKLHCGYIMTESLSVDTFLQDVYCPTLVAHTSKKMLCVCVCGMSHRPCAQTAVFDDVYILMASLQGPETKAVSKNEPLLKQ